MRTVTEIIEAAGGPRVIAKRLELDPTSPVKWRHNGIPERYWPTIREMVPGRLKLDELHAANIAVRAAA